MNDHAWLSDYFGRYHRSLCETDVRDALIATRDVLRDTATRGGRVFLLGNGGSAAIAGHTALDLTKHARVRCVAPSGADWITALANDYGYEYWMEKTLAFHADAADAVVLISSSGRSPNVLRAADHARGRRLPLVTLTGFAADNPLRQRGDVNLWVDSRAYNIVEMTHHIWLLAVCDLLIGTAEYSPSAPVEPGA